MGDAATDVTDETERSRFLIVEEGIEAQLVYRSEDGKLFLLHTEVPKELGGRGIAGRLVQAAIDRAADNGETVVPWCPYTRSWLEKNPDQAARVEIDRTPPPGS